MSNENKSFDERLMKNILRCYYTSGIIALIGVAVVILSTVIGYSMVWIFNIVITLPTWVQVAIGIALLPLVVAVIKTVCETVCETEYTQKDSEIICNAKFKVEIQRTAFDYSWVFLRVYPGGIAIATETPKNSDAQTVANDLLVNADKIYEEYKAKPHGVIHGVIKPKPQNLKTANDCIEEIEEKLTKIERQLDEMQKEKTSNDTPLPPLTELEKQTQERIPKG